MIIQTTSNDKYYYSQMEFVQRMGFYEHEIMDESNHKTQTLIAIWDKIAFHCPTLV